MSLNAYLKMTGEDKGIKSLVNQPGREDSIMVIATNRESIETTVRSIRRPSGSISGKPQYKPFVITKEVDQSSPFIYKIFLENENMSD